MLHFRTIRPQSRIMGRRGVSGWRNRVNMHRCKSTCRQNLPIAFTRCCFPPKLGSHTRALVKLTQLTWFRLSLRGHKSEVCGLKWSPDGHALASGGNDNHLLIWSVHGPHPLLKFKQHTAAIKAIAWSPHQHGLLASGGGTQVRRIQSIIIINVCVRC